MPSYRVCPLPLEPATGWKRLLSRVLGSVLPKNDPDFHDQRETISHWWLEIGENGAVLREIGFSSTGDPIRCAPARDNWGVFVGEDIDPSDLREQVRPEVFEGAWTRALDSLRMQ